MTIAQAPLNVPLRVLSFSLDEVKEITDIESRLMHLGFIYGEPIVVTKKAPIFGEPFLVEVKGRPVAMSAAEAQLIRVEVNK